MVRQYNSEKYNNIRTPLRDNRPEKEPCLKVLLKVIHFLWAPKIWGLGSVARHDDFTLFWQFEVEIWQTEAWWLYMERNRYERLLTVDWNIIIFIYFIYFMIILRHWNIFFQKWMIYLIIVFNFLDLISLTLSFRRNSYYFNWH